MAITLSGCGKNKSERLNERELEIEQKYGIEIEKVREEDLKVIDDYFAKLPDGFVEELKTYQDYEEYQDRKIYIYVSGDGITDVKNDLSRGDYWILDNNKEIEGQLAYCTMESAYYNIEFRKNHMEAMFSIPLFNPEEYDYSDTTEYFKYLYNEDNQEEAYFIGDEPALDDIINFFIGFILYLLCYSLPVKCLFQYAVVSTVSNEADKKINNINNYNVFYINHYRMQ